MKRKVKFQEGGAVKESARNRQLRETMEKFGREGRRVGLAERARQRQLADRQAGVQRAADQRAIAEFNDRMNRAMPVTPEQARNLGAEPAARPANPRPNIPARMQTAAGTAARIGSRAIPGANVMRAMAPTSLEEGARFEREGLRQAREAQAAREPAAPSDGPAAGSMQTAPRPAPARRPAAAPAPAPRPRVREMTADELNEMELRRIRAERQMEEDDARERRRAREEMMGGSGDIGAASARARGEQVGPPGDYNNFRKGGMVKPKKMMKGGMVAKPKVAAKSKAKPMPFKKGGVIKKGKK